jgi:Domain of unknown function (DUF397)
MSGEAGMKPTARQLGIDPAAQQWSRSGDGDGSIEVAFPVAPASAGACDGPPGSSAATWERGDWVLMRVAGDADGRVLLFDRNEWLCFLDGVRNGEFDDAGR